jgi:hypothetical protein
MNYYQWRIAIRQGFDQVGCGFEGIKYPDISEKNGKCKKNEFLCLSKKQVGVYRRPPELMVILLCVLRTSSMFSMLHGLSQRVINVADKAFRLLLFLLLPGKCYTP